MAWLPLVLGAFLSPLAPQSSLWVVDDDGGPGVDFTTIQAAVDAAASGDVVLVEPGTYAPFVVDGKGLAVVGESKDAVSVAGALYGVEPAITVRSTPPGASVLLQQMTALGSSGFLLTPMAPAVLVSSCAGPVALEEMRVLPHAQGSSGGLRVESSGQVRVARSTLTGGLPWILGFVEAPSLPGIAALASDVALYDCTLEGGHGSAPCGAFGSCGASQPGGPGLLVDAGVVYASGCAIHGGDGGAGEDCYPFGMGGEAPDGGDGIELVGASQLVLLDTTVAAGAAGTGCGAPAAPGVPLVQGTASVVALPGGARSLAATTPAAAGDVVTFEFAGEPFDLVLAGVSLSSAYVYLPAYSGLLLVGAAAFQVIVLGPADAAGKLSVPYASPPLPPGLEAQLHVVQGAWLSAAGAPYLGPAVSLVLHR